MEKTTLIARYLLALMLLVFGLNKFLGFMSMPQYPPESSATAYMVGLSGVHIFPVLGVLYILCAILLASNKAVGLATMIIAPIAFNILLFHFTLDPAGSVAGIILTALLVLVIVGNKEKYLPLVK